MIPPCQLAKKNVLPVLTMMHYVTVSHLRSALLALKIMMTFVLFVKLSHCLIYDGGLSESVMDLSTVVENIELLLICLSDKALHVATTK